MRSEYPYLRFVEKAKKEKTSVWSVLTVRNGVELGLIQWYGAWRQYCFFPTVQAVYSAGCLADIGDFIRQLMEARK